MATNKTNLFDKTLNGSFWNAGVTFERTNPTPLEKYSIFKTLEDAKAYASSNPVAYPGQIITVIAGEQEYSDWNFGELTGYAVTSADGKLYINNVEAKLSDNQLSLTAKVDNVDVAATRNVTKSLDVKPYQIVDTAGTLKPVGDTESLNPTIDALSDAISANIDNISVISADLSALALSVDALSDATMDELGKLEKSLTESLSINIAESAGTTDGILKTYTFSQGGKDLDVKINIPKDFLVKSANLKTVVAEDIAEGGKLFDQEGFEVGDKYIDFVVNAKADASEESHVYLNVKDLVDVYTGSEGSIVDIAVEGTTVKATVKANSIGFAQLCAEVKEYIDTQDAATYLSAKNYADTQDAATYLSATKYVDTVSAALSDDYVKKIGNAQTAAIEKAMEVSSAASAYTDTQIAAHDTAAKELLAQVSADAVTSALSDAKAYTDELCGSISTTVDQKIADLNIGQYAISSDVKAELCAISTDLDGQIEQTLTDAKGYADQTSANALVDAKAYTDELCGSISTTVDQKIADLNIGQYAISSDVKAELYAVSAETLVSANAYTDKKVGDEVTARTEAIQALSDALSGDVKALAEDYGKVKAEYAAVSADYKVVSADHEGRIDTLEDHIATYTSISGSFALSDDVKNDIATAKTEAINAASAYTDEAIENTVKQIGKVLHFIGVITVTDDTTVEAEARKLYEAGKSPIDGDVVLDSESGKEYVFVTGYKGKDSWVEIGDEEHCAKKTELEAEKTAREAADSFLSGKIDEISTTYATKAELTAEETARKAADAVLSNAIDNKIFYGNYGNVISAESLSVVKISQKDYHDLVADEKVADNVVYIVNNDGTYNMYGETISELSTTGIEGTSEAANTLYVNAKVQEAIDEIPLSVSQLVWDITTISCGGADL